jgi:hypothetical protein
LIHVSGTLTGKFARRQTGKSDWGEAKAAASGWESTKSACLLAQKLHKHQLSDVRASHIIK